MVSSKAVGGERLDQLIHSLLPDLSRSAASKLIQLGRVEINGETCTRPGFKLKVGDKVKARPIKNSKIKDPLNIEIIYEDSNCIVINKPVGILSHSKGSFNPEPTVESWLKNRAPGLQGERAGIVHRLDRATSGVMICAKNDESQKWLQKQFSQRKTKKTYIAVIEGELNHKSAIIDMPIERNPKKPQTFRVGINGKEAKTTYRSLKSNNNFTLIELKPETGRTHQLRVHLSNLGHPILGDTLYGGKTSDRLYLHAKNLEITLPNKHRKTFDVKEPSNFEDILVA